MEPKNTSEIIFELGNIQQQTTDAVYATLDSRPNGLNAKEVEDRLASFGKNQITEKKGRHPFFIFLSNMTSMMAILLWVGGIIAIVAQMPELGIAIFAVNIINGAFSFWQEFRASKATEALKRMLPSFSRVIRNGEEQQILAENLVPGDIVLIAEGDKISADARLLMSSDLQLNQSTLTGESTTVRKSYEPVLREGLSRPEMANLIFTGTSVSSGTGKAIVISTGMKTEFGKIASLTQAMKEEQSPLQKELDLLTKQVSLMALLIGVGFFLVAVFFVKEPIAKSFIFSLGMIVAFIPEGLLPTVTLALAMAVQRMAKEHALVKKLSAVETLGCTTVICSDKTGTLTQNEMTVGNLWLPGREYEVTGLGYAPTGDILQSGTKVDITKDEDLKLLISAAALCSNARILPPNEENDRYTVLGDPTEACLGVVAQKAGFEIEALNKSYPRLRELPFDSRRKRMATVHQIPANKENIKRIAYIKGAPKEVMELCETILIDGKTLPITEENRKAIMEANDRYARNGLRVLAVSYRKLTTDMNLPVALSAYTPELVEVSMTFVGLVVMADPPRPEVADAVAICHK
ncbi:MAG: HAD-IC family P-type ATPase, partial [Erysipelotrichaceae bacterium]